MKYLKPALLYLVKIVLIFILTLFIYFPMQLIFKFSAPNLINSAEALLINGIICALAEIVLFFVVFKADFRDEKDADIKLFTISFVIALSLQLIIASINHLYIHCGLRSIVCRSIYSSLQNRRNSANTKRRSYLILFDINSCG